LVSDFLQSIAVPRRSLSGRLNPKDKGFGPILIFFLRLSKHSKIDRLCTERAVGRCAVLKEKAMQYLLMIHSDEKAMQSAPKDAVGNMLAAYGAYTNAMKEAGVHIGGERLQPSSTATVVRTNNGKTSVLNGPYAEIKEQLGGYYLIEARDLDAAIEWAARCPGAQYGAMEVRPIWPMAEYAR
jgi:hypothetical protein